MVEKTLTTEVLDRRRVAGVARDVAPWAVEFKATQAVRTPRKEYA